MVTLVNTDGQRLQEMLRAIFHKSPEARMLLFKLVNQGLTHSEASRAQDLYFLG
jgi:hypothetical protein